MRVLITGGPTRAYLDKVRFLTNLSTGGTAFEIGKKLKSKGVEIAFVVGPSSYAFEKLRPKICHRVETNDEMLQAVLQVCRKFRPDVAIFSAAVLDFLLVKEESGKRSSRAGEWNIRLKPSPKIIDRVGKKFPGIRRIGFKLEWAGDKNIGEALRRRMGVELLVLNFLSGAKARAYLVSEEKTSSVPTTAALGKALATWCLKR